MKEKIIFLFFSFILFFKAEPLIINKIIFQGNQEFDTLFLKSKISIKEETELDQSLLDKAIEEILFLYKAKGYLFTSIKIKKEIYSFYINLIFDIEEKEKYKTKKIIFKGNINIPTSTLMQEMKLLNQDFFTEEVLKNDIERIIKIYTDKGYINVKVKIKKIDFEKNTLSIKLEIDEGKPAKIEDIIVEGNTITKSKIIKKILNIKLPFLIKNDRINKAIQNLKRSEFVEVLDYEIIAETKEKVILKLKVKEKKQNYFYGFIAYGSYEGLGGSFLSDLNNIFGYGEKVSYSFYKDNFIREYKLESKTGLILPLELGIFLLRFYEENFEQQEKIFSLSNGFFYKIIFKINFGTKEFKDFEYKEKDQRKQGSLGIQYNNLSDLIFFPKGIKIDFNYKIELLEKKELEILKKITSEVEYYHSLSSKTTLKFKTKYNFIVCRTNEEEKISKNDYFKLGGGTTLRGYRENQFKGIKIGLVQIEHLYYLNNRISTFCFCDLGYIYKLPYKIGYGFGINNQTRLGLIKLSFGLGEGNSFLEDVKQAKFHFGLMYKF